MSAVSDFIVFKNLALFQTSGLFEHKNESHNGNCDQSHFSMLKNCSRYLTRASNCYFSFCFLSLVLLSDHQNIIHQNYKDGFHYRWISFWGKKKHLTMAVINLIYTAFAYKFMFCDNKATIYLFFQSKFLKANIHLFIYSASIYWVSTICQGHWYSVISTNMSQTSKSYVAWIIEILDSVMSKQSPFILMNMYIHKNSYLLYMNSYVLYILYICEYAHIHHVL